MVSSCPFIILAKTFNKVFQNFRHFIFRYSNRGFAFIEVIIALALVLVTLTIFGVAVSTLPLTKTSRNQNIAYHVAAKKMEELRNTSFTALPVGGPFTDAGLNNLTSATANLSITDYQGSTLIKKATVIVNWLEEGVIRNVILETLMSEDGLNRP